MGCRLIVHADDFGLSREVNDGIIEAWMNGILTSTSITACGEAFDHAVEQARRCPSLDMGIHLTLVEERPLCPPQAIPSLVTHDDRFFANATTFAFRYLAGRIRREEVRAELMRQVDTVLAAGIPISHLDSHQHLHMLPGVWDIVRDLARKFSIKAIRFPRERFRRYMLREHRWARLIQMFGLNLSCAMAGTRGIKRTDGFVGFFFSGRLDRGNLTTVVDNLPRTGACELICHPGRRPVGGRYLHWDYHWQDELEALTDPLVTEHLKARDVSLTDYRDID